MNEVPKTTEPLSPFLGLQRWYLRHCNGEWEHAYGVDIGTLDNPGWSLDIDLKNTELEHEPFVDVEQTGSAVGDNWLVCFRDDEECQFGGRCGPAMLEAMVGVFVAWAARKEVSL